MKRVMGPLDKRRRVTRCQPCATRRIKCEGSHPCDYCVRTGKLCQPQKVERTEVKFIITTGSTKSCQIAHIPKQMHSPIHMLYLEYFADFLHQSHFTREFVSVHTDLMPLVSTSPPLRHVAVAIGSLRASRRCSVRSMSRRESTHYVAFKSYGDSIQALQFQISEGLSAHADDALWCTFLLGLFELMTQTSGDGWAKHMVFGTSKLLQSMRDTIRSSLLRQKLFDAFRILEINRAILYGETTMLSQGIWPMSEDILASEASDCRDSMDTVLTLMMNTSSFSQSLFKRIESLTGHPRCIDLTLDALATQGIEIKEEIVKWQRTIATPEGVSDPFSALAIANCHGLLLFHCRNFTFHSFWKGKPIPSLDQYHIDEHIDVILKQSDRVLQSSEIPGVLLLFPLRMAGANVFETSQKRKIAELLNQIRQTGFVVADVIKNDLEDIWRDQSLN